MPGPYPEGVRTLLTPRMIGAHLVALLCTAIALGLGAWQFEAWQARRAAEAVDLTQDDPVALTDVMGADDPFPGQQVGKPVEVSGTWLAEGTVYVEGRAHEGRDGFWVVTPLTTGGPTEPAVPVVRGWVASPQLAPEPPTGTADLVGWLQPSEGTGALDENPRDDVFPQLRIADLVQRVETDLYGAYVVLDPAATTSDNTGATGLEPADLAALPDAGRFTALRNLLYAVEWWFFGAFAAFIWWRYVQDERAAASEVAASTGGPPADPPGDPAVEPAEEPASTLET